MVIPENNAQAVKEQTKIPIRVLLANNDITRPRRKKSYIDMMQKKQSITALCIWDYFFGGTNIGRGEKMPNIKSIFSL